MMAQIELLSTTVAHLSANPASSAPLAAATRPPSRLFVSLHATAISGGGSPETFINNLDRHDRLDLISCTGNDPHQIDKACMAMLGDAAVCFDNLAKSRFQCFFSPTWPF